MTPREQRLRELLDEQLRLTEWLQDQLDRQRRQTAELRRAVADLGRAFQESLAAAVEAGDSGDLAAVRRVVRDNQRHWQAYLQQIVAAASAPPQSSDE
ncbi:MAG: DUF2203 domain-containing protein [Oscillochloris sp.]|nr:DUF2203 domain-containing protein [Oscillochloris sp.]